MNDRTAEPADTTAEPDTGLLTPVRAGTPVEAAVGDRAWLQAMLDAEAALARSQARLGTMPKSAAAVITEAARAERFDCRAIALGSRETANPVVGLVRALTDAVAEADPVAAEYVHRGSTSQDILDTGAMLVSRNALRLVVADLTRGSELLARLAAGHRDTPMAGRTLGLQAVPITFGLKAAGWRRLLDDCADRLGRLLDGGLPVSLGGAAGTLAGYLEYAELDGPERAGDTGSYVRELGRTFAEETGLADPALPWHALRTPIADLAGALATTAGALGKIALDVQSLARTEVAEVSEPGGAGRGASSAMPHKRNPVLATLIRAAALQVPVIAAGLTQCLLAEDERSAGAWHAEWELLRSCLRLTGGAAHTAVELLAGLRVHPERMLENLSVTGSQVVSERVAAALAPHLGRAAAKALLTEASATAEREGRTLGEVLAAHPGVGDRLGPERLAVLLDPLRYTGASAELVDRALESGRETGPADGGPAADRAGG
ncbi:3-carboxy-cis,cis-muconate cycloisomerase [Streptomyces sp. NPDC006798]|uniref:3-carboxy-cis,cis-muconate cycloisomerase n=1 Tax=Streptomyces sp. NPDC006798 TaxID=3155462 RepID=UPI0033FE5089